MGGRGGDVQKKEDNKDRWAWLIDVEDRRLENYVKRSMYLEGKADPAGRSIHDVGYWAGKELARRRQ